ncbi:hypothetical protein RFI_29182 [Reticulomyxa filosa]|uniref:Uncharacterized protein n=1 Tax=Reticulomyxa filosa TaxID=46433 RepID=X6M596_RETFI|nr:hypothetical protein RFI_29182 [Reticulomyxa filosa]|eukprot:ETO08205.1 hypothetical protein RFI_29182 [Reticulomyxa filosa]
MYSQKIGESTMAFVRNWNANGHTYTYEISNKDHAGPTERSTTAYKKKGIGNSRTKLCGGMQKETGEPTANSFKNNKDPYEREMKVLMTMCDEFVNEQELRQTLAQFEGNIPLVIDRINKNKKWALVFIVLERERRNGIED